MSEAGGERVPRTEAHDEGRDQQTRATELLFRLVGRGRIVGLVVILALVAAGIAVNARAWRVWTLAVIAMIITGSLAVERFLPRARSTSVAALLAFIFVAQLGAIVVTGGVWSPLVIVFIPTSIMAALVLGRRPAQRALAALPIVAVIALGALDALAGINLLPARLDRQLGPVEHDTATWVWTAAVALFTVVGSVLGLSAHAQVERVHADALLFQREAVAIMRERNQELMALSGRLAHEIKNPLVAIQGLSSLLSSKAPPGSREAEQLGVVASEARRVAEIVDRLLDFSRPVRPLALRPAPLGKLAEEIVRVHEGLAAQQGVRLRAASTTDAELTCDDDKVKQILVNLVQNAIDASPKGTTVRIATRRADDGFVVQVDDDGPGLPEELRGRVFAPGVTTKPHGSGLGLSIARALAEQHGGTLAVENRAGGGCRATLTLPDRAREGAPA